MSAYRFKVGDEVVMKDAQIFKGRVIRDVIPPVKGVITSIPTGSDFLTHRTYEVKWHTVDSSGPRAGSNYMDEACLQPAVEPVTEEELAEVYKILGVT